MIMFGRVVGEGRPMVLLHGLFGSGDNWLTLAGKMRGLEVHLPDLRNHGQSFWSEEFDLDVLADDLVAYLNTLDFGPCLIAGHSLGAKVVMQAALKHPELACAIISLDMAPRAYEPQYTDVMAAVCRLDLSKVTTRSQARELLAPDFPDAATLAFLLKSLVADEEIPGRLRWRLNLGSLTNHYSQIWQPVLHGRAFQGPAFFLSGAESDYVRPRDLDATLELFPQAHFVAVPGAGHWLHADQPAAVLAELRQWMTAVLAWELPEWN